MTQAHCPNRGDIVWLRFTPQAGHEQAGRRPAFVRSPAAYNEKSGLMLCCPVTDQVKGYPFEVPVTPSSGTVTGVALADQMRCLDWRTRNASKFALVPTQGVLAARENEAASPLSGSEERGQRSSFGAAARVLKLLRWGTTLHGSIGAWIHLV
ncbi:endoribonuclease MazF [Derxia lacustris]|uniref:endoribonuclease MazF n=1 Tax=Derxia lacustris TaxID=764842 RepID=UPI000A171DC1|nr:endoribonuclease MazF [Derxia lacustris]